MKETKQIRFHMDEKKTSVINVGRGGGGIRVGLIFIGGALATAALVSVLTFGRRLRKSNKGKNQNHDTSTGKTDEFIKENHKDESNACFLPDSSSNIHHNRSNGTEKTGEIETGHDVISTRSFFLEEKSKLEINGGEGDLIYDDKAILLSSRPEGIKSNAQSDGHAATKEEEFSFPVTEDRVLLQHANMTENPYGEGIEMITEVAIETANVDQGEENNQLSLVSVKGEKSCADDRETRELKCQEAEEITAKGNHSELIMSQSSQETESNLIDDHGQESNSTGKLLAEPVGSEGYDFFAPVIEQATLSKDERLKIDSDDVSTAFETVEATEADHAYQGKDSASIIIYGEEDHKCHEHDGLPTNGTLVVREGNETPGAAHVNQCKDTNTASLMIEEKETICSQLGASQSQTIKVLKRDQTTEAGTAHADQGKGSTVTQMFEDKKCGQHDSLMTNKTALVLEEETVIEMTEGKDKPMILTIEEEGAGTEQDAESNAAVERAEAAAGIDPSRDLEKRLIQGQETRSTNDQEDNSVFVFDDGVTSERIPCQNCAVKVPNLSLPAFSMSTESKPDIGFDIGFKEEVHLSAEACEMRKENVASKQASEDRPFEKSDFPPMKATGEHPNDGPGKVLEEVEVISPTANADKVPMDNYLLTGMSEEDSIDDEVDEAIIPDQVEESSEGTGDSSMESNTEPIWPAESLAESLPALTVLKLTDQKETQQIEEDTTVLTPGLMEIKNVTGGNITSKSLQNVDNGRGNKKMTFLEKSMMELAEHNDQPTHSMKRRTLIVTWTFSGLLWSLCFWYFGLAFLKINLIVVLVILLSKI